MTKQHQEIIIAADYRGYGLAASLGAFLQAEGWHVVHMGATNAVERTFYPHIIDEALLEWQKRGHQKLITICGSGLGMCIRANKFPGIRAIVAMDPETAMLSREHNNANVLCLAGEGTDVRTAVEIVSEFILSDFDADLRQDRVAALDAPLPKAYKSK